MRTSADKDRFLFQVQTQRETYQENKVYYHDVYTECVTYIQNLLPGKSSEELLKIGQTLEVRYKKLYDLDPFLKVRTIAFYRLWIFCGLTKYEYKQ